MESWGNFSAVKRWGWRHFYAFPSSSIVFLLPCLSQKIDLKGGRLLLKPVGQHYHRSQVDEQSISFSSLIEQQRALTNSGFLKDHTFLWIKIAPVVTSTQLQLRELSVLLWETRWPTTDFERAPLPFQGLANKIIPDGGGQRSIGRSYLETENPLSKDLRRVFANTQKGFRTICINLLLDSNMAPVLGWFQEPLLGCITGWRCAWWEFSLMTVLPAGLGDGALNKPTVWFHIRTLLCWPGAAMFKFVLLFSQWCFWTLWAGELSTTPILS